MEWFRFFFSKHSLTIRSQKIAPELVRPRCYWSGTLDARQSAKDQPVSCVKRVSTFKQVSRGCPVSTLADKLVNLGTLRCHHRSSKLIFGFRIAWSFLLSVRAISSSALLDASIACKLFASSSPRFGTAAARLPKRLA